MLSEFGVIVEIMRKGVEAAKLLQIEHLLDRGKKGENKQTNKQNQTRTLVFSY